MGTHPIFESDFDCLTESIVKQISDMTSELACTYAALILNDDDCEITGDKIATILKAASVDVEPFWPSLFAGALKDVDVLEGTGEEAGPEWLDIDRGGLEDGGDLVASDLAVVIVQDESGICAGELRGHIRNLLDNRNRTQKWDESH